MNTNNTYFENLKRIGHEYEEARVERRQRKQQIIDTYGWDSEELKAWYNEDAAAKFPFTSGACKAYRAWADSVRFELDEMELADFLWDSEVEDFIAALREAGIGSFVVTGKSTSLMENIHALAANGCTMTGLCTFKKKDSRWLDEEPSEVQGIRFTVA